MLTELSGERQISNDINYMWEKFFKKNLGKMVGGRLRIDVILFSFVFCGTRDKIQGFTQQGR